MKRSYALLEIRSADDAKRIIEGIANTGDIDSYNSVLEPEGAQFKLPMPALYQHNSRQPIGHVVEAKVGKKGISVRIQMAKAGIAGFIDEAWALIRAGLVQGLSVGFEPVEEVFDKSFGGFRYPKWKWHELSLVTIPANEAATITSVRSADEAILAALGKKARSLHLNPPASGPTKGKAMKPISEHIAALKLKRAANDEKLDGILAVCAEKGETRDAAQQEIFDTLTSENEALDRDIRDFEIREKSMLARAIPVNGNPPKTDTPVARHETITVHRNEPKGIGVARMAIAMVRAGNNPFHAEQLARQHWPDNPEVGNYIRTIIEAGDTTTSGWALQIAQPTQVMAGEFLDMLRELILIGKIPNLRQVPFNVTVPLQSAGGTYGYVGEGASKPVTKPTYGSVALRFEKAAGIIVITQELARFSSPSAELLVRNEMLQGLSRFFDTIFVSATAAVTNVQPAGILNGISSTAVTGATAAKFRVDMNTVIQKHITNKRDPAKLVILMSSGMAMSLSSMITTLGTSEFPSINATGGNYLGIPIVTSGVVGTNIIVIDPTDILIAEDPAISIDVSTQASVEMSDAPTAGESSPITSVDALKSLWQNNLVGIRAEQFRTWKVARTTAVEYLTAAAYAPS